VARRDRKAGFRAVACLAILMLLVPYVSATVDSATIPKSTDPNDVDRPDVIATLKTHVAYVGEVQEARMDGVIMYVDNISDGSGITSLQQIQDDYLVIASSIPLMQSYAEIARAREDLRVQTQLFSEETKAQMVMFNGSEADMRSCIRSSTDAVDNAFSAMTDSLWLAKDSARLTLFNQASVQRTLLIRSLGKQGIDITLAKNISDRIDAQHSGLRDALTNKSAEALKSTNTAIKTLTRQFRENVASSRAALAIEMKRDAMMSMK
jgi:gas vesicle protein